jgi:ATP-binding cassette subfamily B protein
VENLDEFLRLEPAILPGLAGEPGLPVKDSIRFEGVSFTYPGGFHQALDKASTWRSQKESRCLVGHNGAGKSTLIKLLCRFYDPDAGRILLDGVDLRSLDLVALRRQITVLFQDPCSLSRLGRENIAFGDVEGAFKTRTACGRPPRMRERWSQSNGCPAASKRCSASGLEARN